MKLINKKCVSCEGGAPPLTEAQIQEYLPELKTGWKVLENKKIQKEFVFKGFAEAIAFVNKVANLAEAENHHPDIHIFYRKVTIELWTHSVNGLSENDFILAAKVDNL